MLTLSVDPASGAVRVPKSSSPSAATATAAAAAAAAATAAAISCNYTFVAIHDGVVVQSGDELGWTTIHRLQSIRSGNPRSPDRT
jgi:hypothetical protein